MIFAHSHLSTVISCRSAAALESEIEINAENASRVLELCELIPAPRLREAAIAYSLVDLAGVTASESFRAMSQRAPHLARELMGRVDERNASFYGELSTVEMRLAEEEERVRIAKEKAESDPLAKDPPFPWKRFVGVVVLAILFKVVSIYNTSLGPGVPVFNMIVVAVVIYLAAKGKLDI
jgi:hypothetical protein